MSCVYMETEPITERSIQSVRVVERDTPGVGDLHAENDRESDTVGHWRASFDAAPGRRGRGGREISSGTSGGNSDIPRDFMKISVAATSDVPVLQSVLTLSANSCPTRASNERQVHAENGHSDKRQSLAPHP